MLSRDAIIKIVSKALPDLKSRYGVKSLSLFGSYARGEEAGTSDIDMLVEFKETVDLIDYIKMENDLADLLDQPVDLVMRDSLKLRIQESILSEAVDI